MAQPRNVSVSRTLEVLGRLMEGAELTRADIEKTVKVSQGTAQRVMTALATFPGVETGQRGKGRTLRFRDPAFDGHLNRAVMTLSVCLGTSLASLFSGTTYAKGMERARDRLLRRSGKEVPVRELSRKFYFAAQGGELALKDNPQVVDDVLEAVLGSRYLVIDYTHFDGNEERLRIQPLSLVVYQHQLYVLGRPDATTPLHPYRVSRITESELDDDTFRYPPRTEFEPERLFADSLGVFVGGHDMCEVHLRLAPAWRTYARTHNWHRSQQISHDPDGWLNVRLRVRSCPELKRWLLGFGRDADILSPTWLREEIHAEAAAIARRATTPPPR